MTPVSLFADWSGLSTVPSKLQFPFCGEGPSSDAVMETIVNPEQPI
jgi:hypothetical protein